MMIYKTGEIAKILGVTVTTIQRWDRSGKLKAGRLPSGHRFYTREQVDKILKGGKDE